MARIRQIKPEFCDDEELAKCSRDARLLFICSWMHADRAGRMRDSPRWLKVKVFPYDDDIAADDVERLLSELERQSFILRYVVDGRGYIQIRTFEKHQHPHVHEPASKLPQPLEGGAVKAPDKYGACTVLEQDRPVVSPLSIIHTPYSVKGGCGGGDDVADPDAAKATMIAEAESQCRFELFWAEFPYKCGKPKAAMVWKRIFPSGPTQEEFDVVMGGLRLWSSSWDWRKNAGQFIQKPANWLADRGWESKPKFMEEPSDGDNGQQHTPGYTGRGEPRFDPELPRWHGK